MKSEKKPLLVALTCDTDADEFDPSIAAQSPAAKPEWKGVADGIPLMVEAVNTAAHAAGLKQRPRFTWFVRVDQQIGYYYGDQAYLLRAFSGFWDGRRANGDEIGWHPHIYHLSEEGRWESEKDEEQFVGSLRDSHAHFTAAAQRPTASRIGEARFSNRIAEALDDLGVLCDSSAMPGRWRHDDARTLDWRGTPQHPYRPSTTDYRVPGPDARALLEVPMTMVPVKAEYDARPYLRYVDLSFRHECLRDGLRSFLAQGDLLVSMTHPSGVLSSVTRKRHGLIAFDIENYHRNVDFIFREAVDLGRAVEFVTMTEIHALHRTEGGTP